MPHLLYSSGLPNGLGGRAYFIPLSETLPSGLECTQARKHLIYAEWTWHVWARKASKWSEVAEIKQWGRGRIQHISRPPTPTVPVAANLSSALKPLPDTGLTHQKHLLHIVTTTPQEGPV